MNFKLVRQFIKLSIVTMLVGGCGTKYKEREVVVGGDDTPTNCAIPVSATFSLVVNSDGSTSSTNLTLYTNKDYMWKLEVNGGCAYGYRASISGVAAPILFRRVAYFTRRYTAAASTVERVSLEVFDNDLNLAQVVSKDSFVFNVAVNNGTSTGNGSLKCTVTPSVNQIVFNSATDKPNVNFLVSAKNGTVAAKTRVLSYFTFGAPSMPTSVLPTDYATVANTVGVQVLRASLDDMLGALFTVEEETTGVLSQCGTWLPVINYAPPVVPPALDLIATANGVNYTSFVAVSSGTPVKLTWTASSNVLACQLYQNNALIASTSGSGSYQLSGVTSPRDMMVRCQYPAQYGYLQELADTVKIALLAPPPVGTVDIKANGSNGPISVAYGTNVTISWNTANTTACTVTPSNRHDLDGSLSKNFYATETYSISCTSPGGPASDSVTVNVVPPDYQMIFVTKATYPGDLGGVAGADAKCQAAADAAGLMPGHTFRAVIGDRNTHGRDHISIFKRIVRSCSDKAQIAANGNDFWDGKWGAAVQCSEDRVHANAPSSGWIPVWNSLTTNGYTHGVTCDNWYSSSRSKIAFVGDGNDSDHDHFFDGGSATKRCDFYAHLYCISQ